MEKSQKPEHHHHSVKTTKKKLSSHSSINTVSKKLIDNKELILNLWAERTKRLLPAASQVDRKSLINSLPQFLDDLAIAINLPGSERYFQEVKCELAKDHGEERSELEQYDLGQVIEEYYILRKVLFEVLESSGPLRPKERDIILEAIHIGVRNAATEFVRIKEREGQLAVRESRHPFQNLQSYVPTRIFKALFDSLPSFYLILKPNLSIVAANQAYLEATMTKLEDILGKNMFEVFPDNPHDHNATGERNLKASFAQVIYNKTPHMMTIQKYDLRNQQGKFEEHFWSPLNTPILNEEGELIYIVHRIEDVTDFVKKKGKNVLGIQDQSKSNFEAWTERLEAEIFRNAQAAWENQERLRIVLEGVKDHAIIRMDCHGFVQDWNKGAENIFGWSKQEVLGKHISFIFTPEELFKHVDKKEMTTALEEGKAEDNHWRLKKDGTKFFAMGIMNPLKSEAGELYGYIKVLRDYTAQKMADEIRENFFRLPEVLICLAGPDGYFKRLNQAWENILGYSIKELISRPYIDFIHPDDIDSTLEEAKKLAAGATTIRFQNRYRSKEGIYKWIDWTVTPLQGILYGVARDISDQKKIESALRESEERFRTLMKTIPHIVWLANTKSNFIYLSQQWEEYTGMNPEEHDRGKKYLQFIHPDYVGPTLQEVETALNNHKPISIHLRIKRADGEFRWHLAYGRPFYAENDEFCGWIGTTTDIHEQKISEEILKESESRFRQLANALPQIIWTAQPNGFVDWYSDWWYQYIDCPEGTTWDDEKILPMHPEDLAETKIRWYETVQAGNPFHMEQRFRHGLDGQYRWHLVRAVPIRDSNGSVIKYVGANTDIHDQKIIHQELLEERSLRELFISTLTHDLRNPLSAAKISAQLAYRSNSVQEIKEHYLLKVLEAIDRAAQMIEDLLDANRIKAGEKLPLKINHCDLHSLASDILEEQTLIHGDRFVLKTSGTCEGQWSGEGLRRVLDNLINNAVKYGFPQKPITVAIESSENHVILSVHNWGGELSQDEFSNLFKMFRRTKSAETSGHRGWGIGLTLVKGIVEAHHGRVWVESSPEKGTTFFIELPCQS